MPLEKTIVNSIMKYLHTVPGCLVRKRHGTVMGVAGDPDLYGSLRGVHFEMEVKQVGNDPTPIQIRRLEEWAAAGAIVGVVHNVQEVRGVLGLS